MLKLVARVDVEAAAGLPPVFGLWARSGPLIESRDPMDLETAANLGCRKIGNQI